MIGVLLMTACANVSPTVLPASLTTCRAPEHYPVESEQADLVEALNDTYLAWEECADVVERINQNPVRQ